MPAQRPGAIIAAPSPPPSPVPLVLLPGTACDARLFAPMLARLGTALAGRATTIPPIEGDDADRAAAAMLAAAPPRFVLAGFSLGAIVAIAAALAAPDRVVGVALIDGNARARPVEAGSAPGAAVAAVARDWPRLVAPARRDDAGLRTLVEAMARDTPTARFAAQRSIAAGRPDRRARLASLTMPALVVAGGEDALCPPPMQREMAAALPDAVLALLPGIGHFAPLEAPADVAAHVAAWLARIDGALRSAGPATAAAIRYTPHEEDA